MKTLLFRNLFRSEEGKEDNEWFHQATFYLASSLKANGLPLVISDSRFSLDRNIIDKREELDRILGEEDIGFVVITLLDWCFDMTRELSRYIKERSDARIILGGLMPTLAPQEVMEGVREADLVVRGDGEGILPRLVKALEESGQSSPVDKIKSFKGVLFRHDGQVIGSAEGINKHPLEEAVLDFSLLSCENVSEGLNMTTSKGCRNSCSFCTMPDRGDFRAMSVERMMHHLSCYKEQLEKLFGKDIPERCFLLSFNDDDFLADRDRAIEFFKRLKETDFRINYIQASINSFFRDGAVDMDLIASMEPGLFKGRPYSIYLGTENLVDDELKRLGKGNDYGMVRQVIDALSRQGINQAHHLILTNVHTTLDNICENLVKAAALKRKYNEFNILTPVIPNLVSFCTTNSYKSLEKKGMLSQVQVSAWVGDYSIVEKDIPLDPDVERVADMSDRLGFKDDYSDAIENVLLMLLRTYEGLACDGIEPGRQEMIKGVLSKYKDYDILISRESGIERISQKNNLQLMVSRRCSLRCSYCPIPKKDSDMSWEVMRSAIDLLFKSGSDEFRLDFTGGEPLLRFDLVRMGMDYALDLSSKTGKSVSFYMVTNALLLNKDIADYLDGKDMLLELSIDGPEEVHNECKIPLDDVNPYRKTTEGLRMLDGYDIDRYVVLVATTGNVHMLKSSFDHIVSLGVDNIDINYAIGEIWSEESIRMFFSQMDEILDHYDEKLSKGEITIGNMGKRSEPAVLNTEFMVDTDGSIRLLNEFLFKSDYKGKSPYDFGDVMARRDLPDAGRFKVYYSIIEMFGSDLMPLIRNNINMGMIAKKYFKERRKSWSKRSLSTVQG